MPWLLCVVPIAAVFLNNAAAFWDDVKIGSTFHKAHNEWSWAHSQAHNKWNWPPSKWNWHCCARRWGLIQSRRPKLSEEGHACRCPLDSLCHHLPTMGKAMQPSITDCQLKVQAAQKSKANLKVEFEDLKEELKDARSKMQGMQAAKADLGEELKTANRELRDTRSKMQGAQVAKANLKQQLMSAKSELMTAKSELKTVKRELMTAKSEIKDTRSKLQRVQAAKANMRDEVRILKGEVEALKRRPPAEPTCRVAPASEPQLQLVKAARTQLEGELHGLKGEIRSLRGELEEWRSGSRLSSGHSRLRRVFYSAIMIGAISLYYWLLQSLSAARRDDSPEKRLLLDRGVQGSGCNRCLADVYEEPQDGAAQEHSPEPEAATAEVVVAPVALSDTVAEEAVSEDTVSEGDPVESSVPEPETFDYAEHSDGVPVEEPEEEEGELEAEDEVEDRGEDEAVDEAEDDEVLPEKEAEEGSEVDSAPGIDDQDSEDEQLEVQGGATEGVVAAAPEEQCPSEPGAAMPGAGAASGPLGLLEEVAHSDSDTESEYHLL